MPSAVLRVHISVSFRTIEADIRPATIQAWREGLALDR